MSAFCKFKRNVCWLCPTEKNRPFLGWHIFSTKQTHISKVRLVSRQAGEYVDLNIDCTTFGKHPGHRNLLSLSVSQLPPAFINKDPAVIAKDLCSGNPNGLLPVDAVLNPGIAVPGIRPIRIVLFEQAALSVGLDVAHVGTWTGCYGYRYAVRVELTWTIDSETPRVVGLFN